METKGEKIRGTTVGRIGNMNKPIDMIVYQQAGQTYLLMAKLESAGVMKISTADIARNEGLTTAVSGGGYRGAEVRDDRIAARASCSSTS